MFIAQAFKAQNEFWRYLVGSLVVFFVSLIGQIPWILAIFLIKGPEAMVGLDESEIMTVLDSNLTLFLLLFSFALGMLGLLFVLKYIHKQKLKDITTTRKKLDWGRIWFGFGLVAIFSIAATLIDYFFVSPEDYVFNFKLVPFLILSVIAIIFIPIQTSLEEFLFRGYLMQGFGILAKNRWFPLVMTSLIFGLLHIANPEIDKIGYILLVFYIGTGFLLGIMTLMDEGMELALGCHAANNLITALLVTADWQVFNVESLFRDVAEPSTGVDIVLPVLIGYPIFLIILAYKYKWKGWREKLFGKVEPPEINTIDDHLVAD